MGSGTPERKLKMKLYYMTTSKDRVGNRRDRWHVTDSYETKTALKKAVGGLQRVTEVLTEEQLEARGEVCKAYILENAKNW